MPSPVATDLPVFDDKDRARRYVWDRLQDEGDAAFPFPPHGRIPNFKGAKEAAERLLTSSIWKQVERVKVNPDSPQRHVRQGLLERGITLYMPTPRLKGGFMRFDPDRIADKDLADASKLSKCKPHATHVDLEDLPQMDRIVCGSVAVTRGGHRAGKGEGYSDLEYGILRELGHYPAPVVTTVHAHQVVGGLPRDDTDLPLSMVCTPDATMHIDPPPPAPHGIDWSRLDDDDLDAMPVLKGLRPDDRH